jgi:amino acid adenylation domain-containing protein/non-ribosomal peptide synthase protein (TIGR01720 family)
VRQTHAEEVRALDFTAIDLSAVHADEQTERLSEQCTRVQGSLSLSEGPLVRSVLFDLGPERGRHLLIVAHHLVVDGVSWRVLLEDLQVACEQLLAGRTVDLGGNTWSYQRWGNELLSQVESGARDTEVPYWLEQSKAVALPLDSRNGPNTAASCSNVTVSLARDKTQALLKETQRAYRTDAQDLIVLALAKAVSEWIGHSEVCVWLEGHGREELFEKQDLTRTVGWFTTLYPVGFRLANAGLSTQIKAIKESLRAVPDQGIGYGLLRYLHPNVDVRTALSGAGCELVFNYLGQLDNLQRETGLLRLSDEATGAAHGAEELRDAVLSVNAAVLDGELHVDWTFSDNLHERATIERLSNAFLSHLEAAIEHCSRPESFGYTPSDFPLARLDQSSLDRVVHGARRAEFESIYSLSPMQQGMLFHTIYAPESGIYFDQLSCILEGADVGLLERAFQSVVERHGILRTSFVWEGLREPVQRVHQSVPLHIERLDWQGIAPEALQTQREELLANDRAKGFELNRAPLLRLVWADLGNDSALFVYSFSHLLLDGWSNARVLAEVFQIYEALKRDEVLKLPPSPAFETYIAWLSKQDRQAAESFWRDRMNGFAVATPLPTSSIDDKLPEALQSDVTFQLSPETTAALERFARAEHVSVNNIVQAGWAVVLAHYSGERDVVFGVTMSGRPNELPAVDAMVGLFINTVPLRTRLSAETTVRTLLEHTRNEQAAIQAFEWTPLSDIQRWSELPAGSALFDSILVFENYPVDANLSSGNAPFEVDAIGNYEQTNYALTLSATLQEELSVTLTPRTSEVRIDVPRLAKCLETLLVAMMQAPESSVFELPLFNDLERRTLASGRCTQRVFDSPDLVQRMIEARAKHAPDALAIVSDDSTISYGVLNERANRLANRLRHLGVGPDVMVAVCAERSVEMVLGMLAVLKAGGAYVPLDPQNPSERLAFMLRDSGARILLAQQRLLDSNVVDGANTQHTILLDLPESYACEPATSPEVALHPEHTAYVVYTSGTTGQPKGTLIPHRALTHLSLAVQATYGIAPADRLLQFDAVGFDAAAEEIFSTLVSGATLVLRSDKMLDVADFWSACEEMGVTIAELPTAFFHQLVSGGALPGQGIRGLVVGGERLLTSALNEWYRRVGDRVGFYNAYGPTETTVTATVWKAPLEQEEQAVPIGQPLPNLRAYVLDPDMLPVPDGAKGELYLGGEQLARGYLGQPSLTADCFVPDPFGAEPGSRLYRTGDLACVRADGQIHYLGRSDTQLKIRGYRVEVSEIEAVLGTHPSVQHCAVEAKDAGGGARLMAYVVVREGEPPTPAELRAYLERSLPQYMIPSSFTFLAALPLTPNGKLDRKALPTSVTSRDPNLGELVLPQLPLEREVVSIWEEVLDIRPIGVLDNFFSLGGDSLLAIRLLATIEQRLGHRLITLAQLFETPTPRSLAMAIQQKDSSVLARRLVLMNAGGSGTPFFCVHALAGLVDAYAPLAKEFSGRRPFYGVQAAGLALGEQPLDDVRQMAASYLEAIREVQPKGPYLLGGWSMGARIAFEMAQQLSQAGEEVGALVLIDAGPGDTLAAVENDQDYAHQSAEDAAKESELPDDEWRAQDAVLMLADMAGIDPELIESLNVEEALQLLADEAARAQALPSENALDYIRQLHAVVRCHTQADATYVVAPLAGPLTLIRANDSSGDDTTNGWSQYAESVVTHCVPGSHLTMFEDAPRQIAEALDVALCAPPRHNV